MVSAERCWEKPSAHISRIQAREWDEIGTWMSLDEEGGTLYERDILINLNLTCLPILRDGLKQQRKIW